MSDDKASLRKSISKVDPADLIDDRFAVHLPASLQALSEAERDAAAKRATRKIDIMLIPACKRAIML